MKPTALGIIILCSGRWAIGQPEDSSPRFEIADVHANATTVNVSVRTPPVRGGRYELTFATMLDLIRISYGFDPDKILGGPSWLEMDRFDVRAKVPAGSTPETQKLMLQALLAERFKLVIHKDTKLLPSYALRVAKKPQLKEAAGTEEAGCKLQTDSGPPAVGGGVIVMSNPDGTTTTFTLGPGLTLQYHCRNMTMAAFAAELRGMMGAPAGMNPVLDETGLNGNWNFDVRWSMGATSGPDSSASARISMFDAFEKQLGLKLEARQVPTPVLVVDRVNQKPTPNSPDLAEALPVIPPPAAFEVASVKPSGPDQTRYKFQIQPGGRLIVQGTVMSTLIFRAFAGLMTNLRQVAGIPGWADAERFEITAQAPTGPDVLPLGWDTLPQMMRALLTDRFKMAYHTEDRPVTVYSLTAGKLKMKKADPASRTYWKNVHAPPGSPASTQAYTCQNISMAQFAERLQNLSPELIWPVTDSTGLEGGWDFTLTFNNSARMMGRRGATDGVTAGGGIAQAPDPIPGYTLVEALEKQLGLKLEAQKRNMPVIVIDHLERKPTEN